MSTDNPEDMNPEIKSKREDKRQTKPDDGIAVVPAPMSDGRVINFPMKEAIRDAYNKMPRIPDRPKAETPVDASNYTTQELEEHNYSGYRLNKLNDRFEIWVLGRVAVSERASRIRANPGIIADMHEKAFSTTGSIVEVDLETKAEDPDEPKVIQ